MSFLSTMMHTPLGVATLYDYGRRHFFSSRVAEYDGNYLVWHTYKDVESLAGRMASALSAAGLQPGDRVGTFLWNGVTHLAAYLAVPSMGSILHTVNCRLAPDQIAYIINHSDDRVVLVDGRLEATFAQVLPLIPSVKIIVVEKPEGALAQDSRVISLEQFLEGASEEFTWSETPEEQAAGICYTSGTTGNPKGVVYSQKTTYLHALASRSIDTFGVHERDTILMLPSMFHANAWGFPYSGWMSGADMILPGPYLQVPHLRVMINTCRPTLTALVPTLLGDLLRPQGDESIDLSSFRAIICGGSAVPSSMIEACASRWQVAVIQGWGMTETSPMCVLSHPPKDLGGCLEIDWRMKSGRPVPGIEVRVVDDEDQPLSHDGQALGELQLRGSWVTGEYLGIESDSFTSDGWLRTGDIGHIEPRGYVQLTDRKKDVIKSGGEWISSVDLEDALLQHPDVEEVAVIAIPDDRWQERPLAIIVPGVGTELDPKALRVFLSDKVARFWLPDYWYMATEISKTSVGKLDKKKLRDDYSKGVIVPMRVND
jgi:fatty-acyl-CoA synthase